MDEDSYDFPQSHEPASVTEAIDRLLMTEPSPEVLQRELLRLRMLAAEQEELFTEASQAIEKLEAIVKKVTAPANRIGTFLASPARDTCQIVVGGADYYCNVDPRIDQRALRRGTRVLVNEAYVIVGDLGYDRTGPVTKITEVLGHDRLRVGGEMGTASTVLQRSDLLLKEKLKAGDEVRVDANYKVAMEVLANPKSDEYFLDAVPELPWEKVGGQDEALSSIRSAIEFAPAA